jgi:dUTPase
MSRKFEIAKGWEDKGINLPTRQTTHAAGYDFEAAEDVTLVPIWRSVINGMTIKPQLVATGIKAQMEPDEALFMYNRSGNPLKKLIMLANGVGVVDLITTAMNRMTVQSCSSFGISVLNPFILRKVKKSGRGFSKSIF